MATKEAAMTKAQAPAADPSSTSGGSPPAGAISLSAMLDDLRAHIAEASIATSGPILRANPLARHLAYLHKLRDELTPLFGDASAVVLEAPGDPDPRVTIRTRVLTPNNGLAIAVAFENKCWGLLLLRLAEQASGSMRAQITLLRIGAHDFNTTGLPSYCLSTAESIVRTAAKDGHKEHLLSEWDEPYPQGRERTHEDQEAWCRAITLEWAKEAVERLHWPPSFKFFSAKDEMRWREVLSEQRKG